MLKGTHNYNIDNKGRVVLATSFRDGLGKNVVITKSKNEKCLLVFSESEFDRLYNAKAPLSLSEIESKEYIISNYYSDNALDIIVDSANRIIINKDYREYAQIDRDCIVIGRGNYIMIWNEKNHAEYVKQRANFLDD
jgi:MraZ protein